MIELTSYPSTVSPATVKLGRSGTAKMQSLMWLTALCASPCVKKTTCVQRRDRSWDLRIKGAWCILVGVVQGFWCTLFRCLHLLSSIIVRCLLEWAQLHQVVVGNSDVTSLLEPDSKEASTKTRTFQLQRHRFRAVHRLLSGRRACPRDHTITINQHLLVHRPSSTNAHLSSPCLAPSSSPRMSGSKSCLTSTTSTSSHVWAWARQSNWPLKAPFVRRPCSALRQSSLLEARSSWPVSPCILSSITCSTNAQLSSKASMSEMEWIYSPTHALPRSTLPTLLSLSSAFASLSGLQFRSQAKRASLYFKSWRLSAASSPMMTIATREAITPVGMAGTKWSSIAKVVSSCVLIRSTLDRFVHCLMLRPVCMLTSEGFNCHTTRLQTTRVLHRQPFIASHIRRYASWVFKQSCLPLKFDAAPLASSLYLSC